MHKAVGIILAGAGAAALAGGAIAASRDTHVINVPLPDGSTARVEYVGNVAPKVSVIPAASPFGMFDRSMFDMQRQIDTMMRQIDSVARMPAAVPGMNVAAYSAAPPGTQSVSVVSTSNGAKTCTRTTKVISQGAGKPPKVVTNIIGDCSGVAAPPAPVPPPVPAKPTA